MGSTCTTCDNPALNPNPNPSDKDNDNNSNQFSKEIQQMVTELRKKHQKDIKEAIEVSLGEGKMYKGRFKNGNKSGYGQFYNGTTAYLGMYDNNLPNGQGLMITNFKNFLKCTFINGVPTGQTKQRINYNYFHGQYSQGKKSKGILTTDQFLYEGSFQCDKFHGYGILEFENGDKYEGDFNEGVFHGDGVYQSRENGRYKGEFKRGVYEGKGIFVWPNGDSYSGEYRNGVRNGRGKLVTGEEVFEGVWVNGGLEGYVQKSREIGKSRTVQQDKARTKPKNKTEETAGTGSELAGYVIELF